MPTNLPHNYGAAMDDPRGYITFDQAQALIKSAGGGRDELLLKVLFYTGRRIGEIVDKWGITPSDINHDGGIITFNILKKNPRRKDRKDEPPAPPVRKSIPVYPALLDALRTYIANTDLRGRPTAPVFNMTIRNARYIVERAGMKAADDYPELFPDVREKKGKYVLYIGNKPLHPHHFRHGFAVHLAKNVGGTLEDSRQVQLLLQHSDIRMTQEYLKYSTTDTKRILNRAFGNAEGSNNVTEAPKDKE